MLKVAPWRVVILEKMADGNVLNCEIEFLQARREKVDILKTSSAYMT